MSSFVRLWRRGDLESRTTRAMFNEPTFFWRNKMLKMIIYIGLLIGAYYAGAEGMSPNDIVDKVFELFELVMSMEDDAKSVVEKVQSFVESVRSKNGDNLLIIKS